MRLPEQQFPSSGFHLLYTIGDLIRALHHTQLPVPRVVTDLRYGPALVGKLVCDQRLAARRGLQLQIVDVKVYLAVRHREVRRVHKLNWEFLATCWFEESFEYLGPFQLVAFKLDLVLLGKL